MSSHERELIAQSIKGNCLMFGDFTLKAGRRTPYFFNSSRLSTGRSIELLGSLFAKAIIESNVEFDVLFGAAYKGIPLVAVVAAHLSRDYGRDVPYMYNRKEAKTWGEGGLFVGNVDELKKEGVRVVVIDDVITAGTAAGDVIQLLKHEQPSVVIAGLFIIFDRQERVEDSTQSACSMVQSNYNVKVYSLLTVDALISYLLAPDTGVDLNLPADALERIRAYRKVYGA